MNQINFDALTSIPAPQFINGGLTSPKNKQIIAVFGGPPSNQMREGAPITNALLKSLMQYGRNVGPFKVSGIRPALDSLEYIFEQVKKADPRLYNEVRTAGMLNVRPVRGTSNVWSDHSFGTAIDLYFGTSVVPYGTPKAEVGMLKLYPYFHNQGWYWGAEFGNEDAMHYGLALETLKTYAKAGWKWLPPKGKK